MGIFDNIKRGILPEDELIVDFIYNSIEENQYKDEIEKNIDILRNTFKTASIEEKILINKVLFILEKLIGLDMALENFISKAFSINVYKVREEYIDFLKEFFNKIENKDLFKILKRLLKNLDTLSSEELRTFLNWYLHFVWDIDKFYNADDFKLLYFELQELITKLMQQNRIADVMYVEFFTYHIMGNSFHTMDEWREFNQNITKKTENFYKSYTTNLPKANPKQKEKKRIALVVDRIVFNSVFQVWYSLLKALMEDESFTNNYEIVVYSVNYFEKSYDEERCIQMIESLGVLYINPVQEFIKQGYYNNHYEKALKVRQTLINDNIDILITGGVFPIIDFLYLSRTAPLQIYWSHGNCAFDIEGIDKRISHFEQECKEFGWEIFSVPMAKEFLVGTDEDKEKGLLLREKFKNDFWEDVVILGTIGRLIKIDNLEYLEVVSQIMKQNPNTIYLACGIGNIENIKEKLKKVNIDEKRFIFTGMINPHIYGWVIDVYLDSFPLEGGNSVEEIKAKGKPIIRLHNGKKEIVYNGIYERENIYKICKNIKSVWLMEPSNENIELIYKENISKKLIDYFIKNKFLLLRAPVVSKERYIELANFFIQSKDARELGLKTPFNELMVASTFNQNSINSFLEVLS